PDCGGGSFQTRAFRHCPRSCRDGLEFTPTPVGEAVRSLSRQPQRLLCYNLCLLWRNPLQRPPPSLPTCSRNTSPSSAWQSTSSSSRAQKSSAAVPRVSAIPQTPTSAPSASASPALSPCSTSVPSKWPCAPRSP